MAAGETPGDVNPLGFVPDLSMRCVGNNSIGGDDVHGPTTTFPRMCLSNRYTTSYGCRDLVERVTRPLGHPFLQAIEELARTSIEQVLNLLDWNKVLNLKLNHEYGGVPKTGSRAADSACVLQQVAMAKLDLTKPNQFVAAMELYERVEDDLDVVGSSYNPRTRPYGAPLDTRPIGPNKVAQHVGQIDIRSMI
jgi:hypothetical protein